MKRSVFLSTFLFAAVLSPITLQGNDCAPPEQARLSVLELRVGSFHGENTIENFSTDVFSYVARFPESESVGVLWVRTKHPSQSIEVEYDGVPVRLVGESVAELDVPLGISELTIDVATRGPTPDLQTYVVRIKRVPVFACTEQGIREAIARGGGPNYFDCDGPTTVLTEAEIAIDNDVILDGEGNLIVDAGGGGGAGGAAGAALPADEVALKANGAHRVFSIPEGATAELSGFTVTGGSTTEEGGGILNAGRFTLSDSVVTGNTADVGGGVRNLDTGILNVTSSDVSQNIAARFGGGLHNRGEMDMADSEISNNEAGLGSAGISNWPETATMTLTRTSVSGNVAQGAGGGVSNRGTATLHETTISGNQTSSSGGGINNLGNLSMSQGAVSSNNAPDEGGGILNEGALSLENSTVSGNQAGEGGGGVASSGQATLTNVLVSSNSAAMDGGGVRNAETGALTMTGCTVSNNVADVGGGIRNREGGWLVVRESDVSQNIAARFGGGIHNLGGHADVVNTVVSGNQAGDSGSGIANFPETATMTVTRTTVAGNVSATFGGGMTNTGTATLTETTISGNDAGLGGGGITNNGELLVRQSTVSYNSTPEEGGGIRNTGPGGLILLSTTVTGNTAGTWGGGIRNFAAMNIMDTTVSNNAAQGGAGISNRPGAWMALTNSTVSGNAGSGISNWSTLTLASVTLSGNRIFNDGGWIAARNTIFDSDCAATPLVDSLGGNIESPGDTCGLDPAGTDQVNVSELELNLGLLADNGGPTQTHALLPGSFAIDAVEECVNASGFPLLVDQRGAPRPYGSACDSGAFEFGAVPLPRDQCTNDPDRAIYESLEYTNGGGIPSTCIDAATAIAADCVFGSSQSSPPIAGCPEEAFAVISCYPSCAPDVIAALAQCVETCTAEVTGLSTTCSSCYGEWAGCGAQSCVPECAGSVTSPPCTDCLFASGCTGLFDACTGLPGDVDCSGATFTEYMQDFESLEQLSPTALSDDGWIIFGNVFAPGGDIFLYGYGAYPAPNGGAAFSAIETGQGDIQQGAQQLSIYSDYYNIDEQNAGNRVEANTYRERVITAEDVGKTVTFSFDAKRGNINDPSNQGCIGTINPPCDSTADAFIKTIDPDAGFATTNVIEEDTTSIPETWARYSLSFTINLGLVGQLLQVGFSATASNFEPSGVFYDNVVVVTAGP